ncbi:hypothetical protein IW150_001117 [Coemansia sp. RSA 2607]|nr:hypothetical protein IW150_001117 [Coemansia sp. RSA 2607]
MQSIRQGASDTTRRSNVPLAPPALTRTRSAGDLRQYRPATAHTGTSHQRRSSLPTTTTLCTNTIPSTRSHPATKHSARDNPAKPHTVPSTAAQTQAHSPVGRTGGVQMRRRNASALSIATSTKHTLHLVLPPFFPPTPSLGATLSPACTSFAHAAATAVQPAYAERITPRETTSSSPLTATAHGMLCRLAGVRLSARCESPGLSLDEWSALVGNCVRGVDPSARARVRSLVRARQGVPGVLRRALWMGLASAMDPSGVGDPSDAGVRSAVEAIDLDVLRTSDDPRVVAALRHVLHAYYHARPSIGYCQGMDKIAHALLRALSTSAHPAATSDALPLFHHLIDNILPTDMFLAPLTRLLDDQRVLEQLVARRLPQVSRHLRVLGNTSLAPVTFSWFATLFAGHLPDPALWRLWDVVFVEQCYAPVFEAALAVLALVAEDLVACVVEAQVYSVLQGACRRVDLLGAEAFALAAFADDAGARVLMSEIEILRCSLGIT